MAPSSTPDILAKILRVKVDEIAAARAARSIDELRAACDGVSAPRGFGRALRRSAGAAVRAIAEIKRASPSAGAIRPDADPAAIARGYAAGGAAAISVLTDEQVFDGHLSFLAAARDAVDIPLLRKDFIIDEYQVVEARAAGADALLLIVAALDDDALSGLLAATRALGMDALVEVHSVDEAERATAVGADIIGVNHRDLTDFSIDMTLTARLRPRIPDTAILVGESGIGSAADVRALGDAGAHAILVGSRLMAADDPGAALAELLA
jgi:indole-3-glycerol phosphate synthase